MKSRSINDDITLMSSGPEYFDGSGQAVTNMRITMTQFKNDSNRKIQLIKLFLT